MVANSYLSRVDPAYLAPSGFIDSNHPDMTAFAGRAASGAEDPLAVSVRLYYAVRDEILYDAYVSYDELNTCRASGVPSARRGYCVGKAALLAAAARSHSRVRRLRRRAQPSREPASPSGKSRGA
jgi:transglutaminase-like putative cysteine protease